MESATSQIEAMVKAAGDRDGLIGELKKRVLELESLKPVMSLQKTEATKFYNDKLIADIDKIQNKMIFEIYRIIQNEGKALIAESRKKKIK